VSGLVDPDVCIVELDERFGWSVDPLDE